MDPTFSEQPAVPAASTAPAPAAPMPLRVVHPGEGAVLPWVKSSFTYGWAEPGGTLTVNGKPVDIHPGGGWLAMVDYGPGPNVIRYAYEKSGVATAVDRAVSVGGGEAAPGGPEGIKPDQDMGVAPGETVAVSFRGPPGGRAFFHVQGAKGKFPMREANGVYRGFFVPPAGTLFANASIKINFENKSGKDVHKGAPGRLTVLDPEKPWIVEVSTDIAVLRAGPGFSPKDTAGYVMFPPPGVRLRVTGFQGDELRVRMTRDRDLWIGRNEARDLPPGTLPPQAVTYGVTVLPNGPHALVRMAVSQRAPFEVTISDDLRRLDVRFYGTYSNTDWVHLHKDVPWVRQVRWAQETSDVLCLSVETDADAWWGYDARYENGNFVLELRRPPAPTIPGYPLSGLTVAVDAGHSPDTGAVGVTGSLEKDVNLAIAECLREKLEAGKAKVVMIRQWDESVPLYDRPKLAWAARADVLISVHNNALPEGDNPFEKNGFGVYYFHPHSLPFAREVYKAYQEAFTTGRNALKAVMRDDGLHWGNLALPRTSQMPALLTESAYMIYPPEEWWLRQPAFQRDCAAAMEEGLKRYVKRMRSRQ